MRGVFLDYVRVGRKICTTRQALTRFFGMLVAPDRQRPAPGRPASLPKPKRVASWQRLHALREADDLLARAGI
jgi:hypothetical protein